MRTDSKWFRILLFGSIYFIEGAILTYFSGFSAVYLRSHGISFTRIGIAGGIAMLPFVLKIFIGLLSDRVNLLGLGHRVPLMVMGIVLQSAGLLLASLINPATSFTLLLMVMFLVSLGMSTYDTCSDGLAIDTTPPSERGMVQGAMVGGRALGSILLAAAFGLLVDRVSWSAAFQFIAVVTLLPLALVLQVREKERPSEKQFSLAGFRSFANVTMGLFLLLGFLYPLVLYSVNGMLGAYLSERVGMDMVQVGFCISLFGVGAVIGGLVGGLLTDRLGRRSSLLVALTITSLSLLALALGGSRGVATCAVILFGIAFGYYETVYWAAGMDFSDPRIAATMFSIVMAVGNLGIGVGQPLSGILVDAVGFSGLFVTLCIVNLCSIPLITFVFKHRTVKAAAGQ